MTTTPQADHQPRAVLELGQLVIHSSVETIDDHELVAMVHRHRTGDWGDLRPEDAALNDAGLLAGGRILSAYRTGGTAVWIITETDRSVTAVALSTAF